MNLVSKVILIFAVLIIGFYSPDIIKFTQAHLDKTSRSLAEHCMLSTQECTQNSITMTLDQDVIKPLVSSQIKVKWHNSQSETLLLTMKGLEGQLGTVKYKLKHIGNNEYKGNITLPVCTLDEMTWLGELTDGKTTVYPSLRMKG